MASPEIPAYPVDYGAVNEEGKAIAAASNLRQAYWGASIFSFVLFLAHAAPTVLAVQLGADPDAAFWIGRFGLLGLFFPFFFLLQHRLHVWQLSHGRQNLASILVTIIVPSTFFCIAGGAYMSSGRYLYGQLKAEDCTGAGGLRQKLLLQEAYDQASKIYEQCLERVTRENGNAELPYRPTLQSCTEWGKWLGEGADDEWKPWRGQSYKETRLSREFAYLASAEMNHICSGFCNSGKPLWTSLEDTGREGSKCGPIIALKFLAITEQGSVLCFASFVALAVTLAIFLLVRPTLDRLGYV
mmetsp:Transcript_61720/g.133724  ORF Transcript_61720/g.133724 Transcript_61720/m.133724 type:complete len:299 (+) Transcript_61720:107-1003(+)